MVTRNKRSSKTLGKSTATTLRRRVGKSRRKRIFFNKTKYDASAKCWLNMIKHPPVGHSQDSGHLVYLLLCTYTRKKIIYIGKTNDIERRWRQHNGLLAGGASFTTNWVSKGYQWEPVATVSGFKSESEALSFEKKCKVIALKYAHGTPAMHATTLADGKTAPHLKLRKLFTLLNQAKWAKRWDFAYNTPLTLTWFKPNMRPTAALANVGTKQAALAKGISHSSGASISLVPDNVTETIYPTSTSFVKLKPN